MSHSSNLLRSSLLRIAVVVCVFWTGSVVAQSTGEVVINLTVKTKDGSTVEGLHAENFTVTVDKVQQQIVSFETSGLPASVGILIDDSGSQRSSTYRFTPKLIEALGGLLEAGNRSNDYFTLAFNTQPRFLHDWTSDRDLVTSKINELTFYGGTAFFDALYMSIQKAMTGRHPRHVLIVVADGLDSFSKRSLKEVRNVLKKSDVVLYAVAVASPDVAGSSLGMEGQGILDELASVTGGTAFFPRMREPADLRRMCEFIGKEIGSQYRLVIKPEPVATKKWRKILVKANMRDSNGKLIELRVKSRTEFQQ